ncbi:MAG: GNAT family N-acetyltransferase [Lachnospiraceae bacterium]|nr:GNAT family N-acetyltransferase [Lachnospiraceae bacterium]
MGPLVRRTKHLVLRVENESKASQVLALYDRNRASFERFEPTRPKDFYTLDYHTAMMKREFKAYSLGTFLRYYIYKASHPTRIIGAINLNLIHNNSIPYAEIGYKIDALYQNQGYTYEACLSALQVLRQYYGITRVDARIHPDNAPSIRLATKLGFTPLCIEPQSANIMGHYVDLVRYTLDISHIQ